MTALVPFGQGQVIRALDADRLIERWREGRSKQTLRAYSNDLGHFSGWLGGFLGEPTQGTAQAVTMLLTRSQGEANEIVLAYRSRHGHCIKNDRDAPVPQSLVVQN